ncbi:MAG: hypothetical protein ACXWDI_13330, partial [Nocardioides sp.]
MTMCVWFGSRLAQAVLATAVILFVPTAAYADPCDATGEGESSSVGIGMTCGDEGGAAQPEVPGSGQN